MAHDLRLPIIRIIEGSGGGGSVKTIETTGRANLPGGVGKTLAYQLTTDNLGAVPVVALGLGSVAGLGAARLAASHYSLMTKATSAMFVAGPPVVAASGRQGADEGRARRVGNPDPERRRRRRGRQRGGGLRPRPPLPFLSAELGLRAVAARPARPTTPSGARRACFTAIPRDRRKVYKMRPIVEAVVD